MAAAKIAAELVCIYCLYVIDPYCIGIFRSLQCLEVFSAYQAASGSCFIYTAFTVRWLQSASGTFQAVFT